MRTALIIVISVKDKGDLSCADYRFTFLSGQDVKSFTTLPEVLNEILFAFVLPGKNQLKIE